MPSTFTTSSPNDAKFEMMMKIMERLMDRITMDNRPLNKEQDEPKIRKLNFRRPNPPPPPQIRQRDMRDPRNQDDKQIRPHFPENYFHIKERLSLLRVTFIIFCDLDSKIYLTKKEYSMFAQKDDNNDFEEDS